MEFASDILKDDKFFVMKALKEDDRALGYDGGNIREDKEFIMETVKQYEEVLKYAGRDLEMIKSY